VNLRESYIADLEKYGVELAVEIRYLNLTDKYYPKFMEVLKNYRNDIKGEKLIDRSVAAGSNIIHIQFSGAEDHLKDRSMDEYRRYKEVHEEFLYQYYQILVDMDE
jgi:hypothetical protein